MDLIKTDQYGRQIGYVQGANIDFEVGADESDSINDFEIELKRWNWDGSIEYGSRVFSPDTEYGGIVREITYQIKEEKVWGVQFHPEVFHSEDGTQLLKNFVAVPGARLV